MRVGAILWDGTWNGCTSLALVLFKIPGWACTVPLVGEEGRQVWWNVKGWDEDSNTSPLGRLNTTRRKPFASTHVYLSG